MTYKIYVYECLILINRMIFRASEYAHESKHSCTKCDAFSICVSFTDDVINENNLCAYINLEKIMDPVHYIKTNQNLRLIKRSLFINSYITYKQNEECR